MDAFSSSFLSTFAPPLPATTATAVANLSSPSPRHLNITSAVTEEKLITAKPKPKRASPSSNRAKQASNNANATRTLRSDRTLAAMLLGTLDDVIDSFIDPPGRPSVDPKHVLSDNFAPVIDELPPTECEVVEGVLPPCLEGAYIRNGPNPQFLPRGPYHLFDGDGMLHAIRISRGRATLCSRYVKTYKYMVEKEAGTAVFPKVFSGFNGLTASAARGALTAFRVFTGQFNPVHGIGLANTSLALFGNRLFALGESDLPYTIQLTDDGDIETVGRHDFDGKLFMSMTAHPKMDPDTGETFGFRYGPTPPFLTYFRFDRTGEKKPDVPIFSMRTPSFLHDFAITKKYAVFADIQIGMRTNLMELMTSGGSPVGTDIGKIPRIGIIPRYAKDDSEMKWFNVPGFNIVHAINAWDEDDGNAIVLIAPNIIAVEHALERMELVHAIIERVRIDLKTGIVTRHPISTDNLDFAVINPAYMAKQNRYVYAAVGDPMPKISGVVKLDLEKGCTVARRMYAPGCYGGEPFFVAADPAADEDDGYVVTYVHDENSGESRFLVMDAKSPELEVVASVKLPRRVPYGFHGLFVRESDLKKL